MASRNGQQADRLRLQRPLDRRRPCTEARVNGTAPNLPVSAALSPSTSSISGFVVHVWEGLPADAVHQVIGADEHVTTPILVVDSRYDQASLHGRYGFLPLSRAPVGPRGSTRTQGRRGHLRLDQGSDPYSAQLGLQAGSRPLRATTESSSRTSSGTASGAL